jgi:hypothetical protein
MNDWKTWVWNWRPFLIRSIRKKNLEATEQQVQQLCGVSQKSSYHANQGMTVNEAQIIFSSVGNGRTPSQTASFFKFRLHTHSETHICWSFPRRVISSLHRPNIHNTRDKHSCSQRDSKPRSLQTSGRRPTSFTLRPLGSARINSHLHLNFLQLVLTDITHIIKFDAITTALTCAQKVTKKRKETYSKT